MKYPDSTVRVSSHTGASSTKEMQAIINRQGYSINGKPLRRAEEADHISNL